VGDDLLDAMVLGKQEGGHLWFGSPELQQRHTDQLGTVPGKEALETFLRIYGASTPRTTAAMNARLASYYNFFVRNGQEIPEFAEKYYGHKRADLHKSLIDKTLTGQLEPAEYPKVAATIDNLLGDPSSPIIDAHDWRLLGMLSKDPSFLKT